MMTTSQQPPLLPTTSLSLPATSLLPGVMSGHEISLSLQALSLGNASSISSSSTTMNDREVVMLLQAADSQATPLWSWLGQGLPVAMAFSPRMLAIASQEGLLHLLSPEGRSLLPPLQLTAAPSAIAVCSSTEGDRVAALTVQGMLSIWQLCPGKALQLLAETSVAWLLAQSTSQPTAQTTVQTTVQATTLSSSDSTVQASSIAFRGREAVEVHLEITQTTAKSVMTTTGLTGLFSLQANTWIRSDLPLFALSPYNRSSTPLTNAALARNPQLVALATFSQLECDLYQYRSITPDRQQFERVLAAYASLVNEYGDLRRLRGLLGDLKDVTIFVCILFYYY